MPSARRTTRLMNPRGFFSPDSSVSSACSVPMPPPPMPPFIIPPTICRFRRTPAPAGAEADAEAAANSELSASRVSIHWVSGDR
jgi:hypothetical protein